MRDSSPPMTAWGQNPKLPHCNSNGRFHLNERTFRTVPLVRTAQVQSGGGVPGAPLSVLPRPGMCPHFARDLAGIGLSTRGAGNREPVAGHISTTAVRFAPRLKLARRWGPGQLCWMMAALPEY
jgi:hypothetical protein